MAQTSNRTVFRFLDVPPNARSAALSGNHVSLYQADLSLFMVNPAYLSEESSRQFSASYVNFLADANYGFINTAYHIDGVGTVGVGIRYAGYGEFNRLDENNNQNGTFNPGDFSFNAGISRELSSRIRIGGSLNWIHSRIDNFRSTALAASFGALYEDIDRDLTIGFSVRNVGSQITTFNSIREPLPLDISLGVSHKPENFPVRVNLMLRQLNEWNQPLLSDTDDPTFSQNLFRHMVLGGEIPFSEQFIIRIGFNQLQHQELKTRDNFDFAGVGLGLGLKFDKFHIDFSRSSYSELGGIFQISVTSRIKTKKSE